MLCFVLYKMPRTCKTLVCRSYKFMFGQKLGPYTILEILGAGSIGTVYKDEDPYGCPAALKLVRTNVLDTPQTPFPIQPILAPWACKETPGSLYRHACHAERHKQPFRSTCTNDKSVSSRKVDYFKASAPLWAMSCAAFMRSRLNFKRGTACLLMNRL
jgi:hypothetical protein